MKILQRLLPLLALCWATASGAATTSSVPTVAIATTPLYGKVQNLHPNLMLALSVEFPTTGAAYRSAYASDTEYVGYFNSTKCYTYSAATGYFSISGDATKDKRTCSGAFSGNFMNWAASSAIDMLRLAMTGGDRVIDTRTQTVLQRAVLQSDFFKNNSYFPLKTFTKDGQGVTPSQVTPYKYATLNIASCGNHVFFSDSDSSSKCASTVESSSLGPYADKYKNGNLSERRAYRVQVQVCDASEATTRTDLCFSYDGTNYKPVGEMQRNAERVRFAAFGYLNDNYNNSSLAQNERYGGVLRAPMKYLGNSAVNTDLKTVTNTAKEWDAYGVFAPNPLGDATGNSGVVNYLNKFGRTTLGDMGLPTNNPTGAYKTYDPLSELFYEAIRYLQFHPDGPTPEAVNNLTTANTDNFPVYTRWTTDPMINKCQPNYVLTIGDINTHQDNYVPGNTYSGRGDPTRAVDKYSKFDVVDWTGRVMAMELNTPDVGNVNRYPNPQQLTTMLSKGHFSSNNSSYYMAGTAFWAHTSSFRPDMPDARVTTFAIDVNEAGNGTIYDDPHRRSQIYLAAKYGGFSNTVDDGGNGDNNPFRTTVSGKLTNSDVEWESSSGSRVPKNWFLASRPTEMIAAIRKVFAAVVNAGGTLAGVALSSNTVYTDQTIYTPGFDNQWNGKLSALKLSRDSNANVTVSSTPAWEAGARLANRTAASRTMYTMNADTRAGTPFQWANIAKSQQDLLNLNPDTGAADGLGSKRIDYLRGDRSQESDGLGGGVFRQRQTKLGDIINSGPVYVGPPAKSRVGTGYSTFYNTYESRTPVVYVGANDGMLHGFNAETGDEVLAYVPNALYGTLTQLTSVNYNHRAYVDATPTVSEAQIGDKWKSILTAGFGGGAQGVFALDVTDPTGSIGSSFGNANVLWEFTDKDDPDMGNVMGRPIIAKLMKGKDTYGVPIYDWYVIVGNGINSNADDKNSNPDAPSVLFILSLNKGTANWLQNTNYWKIKTPAAAVSPAMAGGMSTPTVVTNSAGAAMLAYAGDLQGNLWKFNLSGVSSTWNEHADGTLPAFGGSPAQPMFIATDKKLGQRQPITMQPSVAYAPGGYIVMFGTGKYYELADTEANPAKGNSFYGIFDGNGTAYAKERKNLNLLTMQVSSKDDKAIEITGTPVALGYAGLRKPGWVMDFLDNSERQITSAALSNGLLYFNSIYTATDNCNTAGGSRSYVVNALTGMPANGSITGAQSSGLLGAPSIIVTSTTSGTRGSVGGQVQTTTTQSISFGADGTIKVSPSMPNQKRPGRQSWREVRNFKMN